MATTPPRRHSRHQSQHADSLPDTPSSTEKKRLKGLFHNGEWWCNCSPRKRAVDRTVQKDTPNRGKPFWACPIPTASGGCNFFLWFGEARLREVELQSAAAAAAAEDVAASKMPSLTQRRLTSCGFRLRGNRKSGDAVAKPEEHQDGDHREMIPQTAMSSPAEEPAVKTAAAAATATITHVKPSFEPLTPGPSGATSKRKRDAFEDDDDEFSDIGSDDERQMAALADKSAEKLIRNGTYDTPGGNHRTAHATSSSSSSSAQPVARTLFPRSQSSKRQKTVSFEGARPLPLPDSPSGTLTNPKSSSTQSTTATLSSMSTSSSPPTTSSTADLGNLTQQVMDLLRGQKIDPSVLRAVGNLLTTSAREATGLARGIDSLRATLKNKDMKIARLQENIVARENNEKLLNSRLTAVKAKLANMY